MNDTPWQVGVMTPTDLPEVQHIESQSPSPWSPKQFAEEMTCKQGLQLVCRAKYGHYLGGFLMARLIPDETEILKIATASEFRRQGVASLLLKSFFSLARQQGVNKFHLELRANNTAALALYEKHAFEMTGRRPSYYTNPQDDALCMTLSDIPGQTSNNSRH